MSSSSSSLLHSMVSRLNNIAIFMLFLSLTCLLEADSAHCLTKKNVIDAPLLTERINTSRCRSIIVDINGGGQFKSVQEAINAVPSGNPSWIIIHVRKGVYREKVHIPEDKPYIFMRGDGKGKTAIVWGQSSTNNKAESATFSSEAPHFVAFGISFKNEAPTGIASTPQNQTVAAYVGADMNAFYDCAFYSAHDTLFDHKGRHYYHNCYIQGSVDFIFGRARSIFQGCEIFVIDDKRAKIGGSITAQNREDESEDSGFVFLKGRVYGVGNVYLGRAKGAFSRVVFVETYLSKSVVPHGWTDWSYAGETDNLFQAEYRCHGPGAQAGGRVPWSKQLSEEEAKEFMSIDYIDGKSWLPAWL